MGHPRLAPIWRYSRWGCTRLPSQTGTTDGDGPDFCSRWSSPDWHTRWCASDWHPRRWCFILASQIRCSDWHVRWAAQIGIPDGVPQIFFPIKVPQNRIPNWYFDLDWCIDGVPQIGTQMGCPRLGTEIGHPRMMPQKGAPDGGASDWHPRGGWTRFMLQMEFPGLAYQMVCFRLAPPDWHPRLAPQELVL